MEKAIRSFVIAVAPGVHSWDIATWVRENEEHRLELRRGPLPGGCRKAGTQYWRRERPPVGHLSRQANHGYRECHLHNAVTTPTPPDSKPWLNIAPSLLNSTMERCREEYGYTNNRNLTKRGLAWIERKQIENDFFLDAPCVLCFYKKMGSTPASPGFGQLQRDDKFVRPRSFLYVGTKDTAQRGDANRPTHF